MNTRITQLNDPALGQYDLSVLSVEEMVAPALETATQSSSMLASQHVVSVGGELLTLPKFLFLGERSGGVPMKIGIYAGLDASQNDTVIAAVQLLLQLELSPHLAKDYTIFCHPIVNLKGFGTEHRSLAEFRHRFAHNTGDDVHFFKTDFSKLKYDGLIFLRSSGVNTDFAATVRSEILAEEVVGPALQILTPLVSVSKKPVRVLPSTPEALLGDQLSGRLIPSPDTTPWPFEIELFAPAAADTEGKVRSLFLATVEILLRYRQFIAHGGTI